MLNGLSLMLWLLGDERNQTHIIAIRDLGGFYKSKQEMLQNILVTFVILSGNFLQGECTVDLFKIPDPNKPCHLEIVKSRNNDTDHSGSRVIDTDVKSQLISAHLLFSITKTILQNFNS